MVRGTDASNIVSQKIVSLISAIEAARRGAALYPRSHPRFQASLDALRATIVTMADGAPLKLAIYKHECFLNGEPPELPIEVPDGFSDRFLRLGLATAEFPPDVTTEELAGFLGVLAADTRRGGRQKTLAELCEEHGLSRITLSGLDYGRLFMEGVGRPAEAGERDEEHLARLLTLWDPRPAQRLMSAQEVEALGRLAQDHTALARLVELSLKGSRPEATGQGVLVEGTVGALNALATRLRDLYPERWASLKKTLVQAALVLDPAVVMQRRPELLDAAPPERRAPTPADEMSNAELAHVLADAVVERPEQDDALALVIRDLVPDAERRMALQPLLASRLAVAGVPERRRYEILAWWDERVVRGEGFRDDVDPLFSALLADKGVSAPVVDGGWLRDSLTDTAVCASYLDDLRGLVSVSTTPEEIDAILFHYHEEFVRLAEEGDIDGLETTAHQLAEELGRCGLAPRDAMARLLGVALTDRLADAMASSAPERRVAALRTAALFGEAGCRVIMTALARPLEWDVREELRQAVGAYGARAADEVVQWLTHTDAAVVKEALLLLRRAGTDRVVGKVETLLGHRDPDVRAAALAAVVRIGGPRAAAAVERCLADPFPRVVQVALDAAVELGVESFLPAVSALIRGHRDDPEFLSVRGAAIALAGKEKLTRLRESLEDVIRGAGSWTVYTKDDKLALPAARALLKMDDPTARSFVTGRARWGIGVSRRACGQALREEKGCR